MNDAIYATVYPTVLMPGEPVYDGAEATHTLLAGLIASVHAQTDAWLAEQLLLRARANAVVEVESPEPPAAAAPVDGLADDPGVAAAGPDDPSGLAALGFGPSMRLRLCQAGVSSRAALAETAPTSLARALGDAIALPTIEDWIRRARASIGPSN